MFDKLVLNAPADFAPTPTQMDELFQMQLYGIFAVGSLAVNVTREDVMQMTFRDILCVCCQAREHMDRVTQK